MSTTIKNQWLFLQRAGVKVGSLKAWARSEVERSGPWAEECRAWLASK